MGKTRVICPNCKRSIRNINAWHYCKEVSKDDIFEKKSDEILLAFYKILEPVSQWKDVEFSATKNCVVFVRNKTFLVVKPMTKFLQIKFNAPEFIDDEDLYKVELWNNKHQGIIRVSNEEEIIDKYFDYIKTSYHIS